MIKFLNFKIIFYLLGILSLSVISHATKYDYQIEIYDTGQEQRLVNHQGYIEDQYKERFKDFVDVSLDTKLWENFKEDLENRQIRNMVAENATRIFFDSFGYRVVNKYYKERMARLEASENTLPVYGKFFIPLQPEDKKGIDNGIDSIYISRKENFSNLTHVVINEAKFRGKLSLSTLDFGITHSGLDRIRQSHSIWNREHFNSFWSNILHYDNIKIIRTATLLNRDGTLKLYEVRDTTGPCNYFKNFPLYKLYPSQWKDELPKSIALKKLLGI